MFVGLSHFNCKLWDVWPGIYFICCIWFSISFCAHPLQDVNLCTLPLELLYFLISKMTWIPERCQVKSFLVLLLTWCTQTIRLSQGLGFSSRFLVVWSDFILYSSSKNKLITSPMPPACKARKLQALTWIFSAVLLKARKYLYHFFRDRRRWKHTVLPKKPSNSDYR